MKRSQQFLMVLGKLLREQRQLRKLTLKDVGQYMSLSHTVVANFEHGKRRLDVGEFVDYCQYLQVKPSRLLEQATATFQNERVKER